MSYDGSIKIDTKIDNRGLQKGLKNLNGDIKQGLDAINSAAKGAALGVGVATSLIIGTGVKFNSEIEQYKASFETMLGSAEKANQMFSDLKKFAAETPFEMGDLAKGTQTLLAFGTQADDVLPTLKMLGDVSLGNKEKFDSLTLAFGQVQSTGRLMGQDLLQMINGGFNPLQVISQKTGKSMADLKKDMEAGAISADMVTEAFRIATSEGGQFYNAMQKQSQTAAGQFSTLTDNVKSFLGELTAGFSETITNSILPAVNSFVQGLSDKLKNGELQEILAKITSGIAGIGTAILGLNIAYIINDVSNAFKGLEATTTLVKNAQAALNFVMSMNPMVLMAVVAISLATALGIYALASNKANSAAQDLAKETANLSKEYENNKVQIEKSEAAELAKMETARDLTNELYNLESQVKSGALTEDEAIKTKERMHTIADQLRQLMPEVAIEFDNETGSIITQKQEVEKLIDSYIRLAKAKAAQAKLDAAYSKMLDAQLAEKKAQKGLDAVKSEMDNYGTSDTSNRNIYDPNYNGQNSSNTAYAGDPNIVSMTANYDSYTKAIENSKKAQGELQTEIDTIKDVVKEQGLEIDNTNKKTQNLDKTNLTTTKNAVSGAKSTSKANKDTSDKLTAQREKDFRNLKYYLSTGQITEEKYYDELAKLRDKYFVNGSEEWQNYTVEIYNYQKSLVEQQKKAIVDMYTAVAEEAGKKIDEIIALQDKMADKLKAYGNLFNKKTTTLKGVGERGEDLQYTTYSLRDISKDTSQLKAYKEAIQAVRKRGASQEFMSILKDMSVEEGTRFANTLLGVSDADFNTYLSQWQEKQQTELDISKELYQEETDGVVKYMKEELEKAGLEVPEGFFDNGKSAAENFGEGFVSKIDEIMTKVKSAIQISMQSMAPTISFAGGVPVLSTVSNTYSKTYNVLPSSGESTAQQLQTIAAAEKVNEYRSG